MADSLEAAMARAAMKDSLKMEKGGAADEHMAAERITGQPASAEDAAHSPRHPADTGLSEGGQARPFSYGCAGGVSEQSVEPPATDGEGKLELPDGLMSAVVMELTRMIANGQISLARPCGGERENREAPGEGAAHEDVEAASAKGAQTATLQSPQGERRGNGDDPQWKRQVGEIKSRRVDNAVDADGEERAAKLIPRLEKCAARYERLLDRLDKMPDKADAALTDTARKSREAVEGEARKAKEEIRRAADEACDYIRDMAQESRARTAKMQRVGTMDRLAKWAVLAAGLLACADIAARAAGLM